ncbi:MAG: cation:proton antiporter [Acidimicrobiales bacterium]
MDLALLVVAFVFGFIAAQLRLPPLVGYLGAGFTLHAFGNESTPTIDTVADIGILLLLFGIGLKLKPRTLLRREVLGTAGVFALIATLFPALILRLATVVGLPLAADLDGRSSIIVAFALSFSSTVFAVKALERTNEGDSLAGRIAIGVLVIQDVIAVVFVVLTASGWPSPWLLGVIVGIMGLAPVLGWVLARSGHGELLIMFGFVMALGVGGELFEAVDIKPDLGALLAGFVLSSHPRAGELAERLLSFKDLFLVGFFVSIGLEGTPTGGAWLIGLILVALVPTRSATILLLLTRFRLRSRTALHTSITLSTYSEFGLIVVAAAVTEGLVDPEWLSVLAVAVSGSFIVTSSINSRRYVIYDRRFELLTRLERTPHLADDALIDTGPARVLIFGMGRVGVGAYDELTERGRGPVVGVDRDEAKVVAQLAAGRTVIMGDSLDRDFWERVSLHPEVELVIAATSNHQANLQCIERIRAFLPDARIAAVATYADQIDELREAGVDVARNLFEEAGQALASDADDEVWGRDDEIRG